MSSSAREYLVTYGLPGFLGRFLASADLAFGHGDRVLLRTHRGPEMGEVLCLTEDGFGPLVGPHVVGEVIRTTTTEDEEQLQLRHREACQLLRSGQVLLNELAPNLPLIDVEILFDRSEAIFHILSLPEQHLPTLLDRLETTFGLPIRFHDLSTPLERGTGLEESGCGKPGCGSGSGGCGSCGSGCSTGNCSRGKVADAEQMTTFFTQLRDRVDRENRFVR